MREKLIVKKLDYQRFLEKSIELMRVWNWDELIGKRKNGKVQSLMEHSINAVQTLIVLLEKHLLLDFTIEEQQTLLLGLIIHDAGKESELFQERIKGNSNIKVEEAPDTDVNLSLQKGREIAETMNWPFYEKTISALVWHHMSYNDTNAKQFLSLISMPELGRWQILLGFIQDLDRLVSCESPQQAYSYFNSSKPKQLNRYLKVDYHSIKLRGISSIQIHKAIQESYMKSGWQPLVYYPTGTLYVSNYSLEVNLVTLHDIKTSLQNRLMNFLTSEDASKYRVSLMHGSITATFFVKPELFTTDSLQNLLYEAADNINNRQAKDIKKQDILQYQNMIAILEETKNFDLAKSAKEKNKEKLLEIIPNEYHYLLITDVSNVNLDLANDIGLAYKEIAVFKMFKNIMDPRNSIIKNNGVLILASEYDKYFGDGAFNALSKTSTFMPAVDAALTVKPYENYLQNMNLPKGMETKKRLETLISLLCKIANIVFKKVNIERSLVTVATDMTNEFMKDIEYPLSLSHSLIEQAKNSLLHYQVSKENAFKNGFVPHSCPICNQSFEDGVTAIDDIVSKPGTFSNRVTAYANTGTAYQICKNCYFERILQQLSLGGKAGEYICIFPNTLISEKRTKEIEKVANVLIDYIKGFANQAITYYMTLSMEGRIAQKINEFEKDNILFSPENIVELFAYKKSEEALKNTKKKIIERVKEEFGLNKIESINDYYKTSFNDWDSLAEGFITDKELPQEFKVIKDEINQTDSEVKVIFETPNFILLPTLGRKGSAIAKEGESKAKTALKKLLISGLFHKLFKMSVAILEHVEEVDQLVEAIDGLVYVPRHPLIRKEIIEARRKKDNHIVDNQSDLWLSSKSEVEMWIVAVKSAILLLSLVEYPEKNDLYQIISLQSGGELLRRIQMKTNNKYIDRLKWQHIQNVEEVLA